MVLRKFYESKKILKKEIFLNWDWLHLGGYIESEALHSYYLVLSPVAEKAYCVERWTTTKLSWKSGQMRLV